MLHNFIVAIAKCMFGRPVISFRRKISQAVADDSTSAFLIPAPLALPSLTVVGLCMASIFAGGIASPAMAETLPHISADCFTYNPGQVSQTQQGVVIRNMSADLTGTNHHVAVLSSLVSDHKKKLDTAALTRLNAAAAYAALTAYHRGMTESCASQPLPEIDEIKNTLPELRWKGVTITRPDRVSTAGSAHMRLLSTTPDIHLIFDAAGIHSAGMILLPPALSGDITFTPAPHPPYSVTINRIHTSLNGSDIDGEGHVLAAEGRQNMQADIHLAISHIGDMINQLGKVAPAKITAALVIARLMGENEPNHRTGWHITLEDDTVRINNIKMPIPF